MVMKNLMSTVLKGALENGYSTTLDNLLTSPGKLAHELGFFHHDVSPKRTTATTRNKKRRDSEDEQVVLTLTTANSSIATKAMNALVNITQTDGNLDPLPISIYGGLDVYLVPFSSDAAATTRFLKKTAKASNTAVKSKYFVHRLDTVNPEFATHPEWSLEATGNVPHLTAIFPTFKENSSNVGAAMVFTLTEKNSQTVMSTSVSQYQAILFDAVEDFIPTSANNTATGSMLNPVIIDVDNTAHKVSSSTLLDISRRMDEVKDYSASFGSKNICRMGERRFCDSRSVPFLGR
jgi:hypothetical protein